MEKVGGEQGLALRHHYPHMYYNLLVNARDLESGHFGTFDMLIPFVGFF